MGFWSLLHFTCFLIDLYLIGFVIYKNPRNLSNRVAAAMLSCFAIWSLGVTFFHNPNASYETAALAMNIECIGWCSFASFNLWHYLLITKRQKILKKKIFYIVIFSLPAFFIYMQWNGFILVEYIKQPYGWSYSWSNSIWTYLFHLYYSSFMWTGIYFCFIFRKKTKVIYERKQATVLLSTIIVAFFLGSISNVLLQELNIHHLPALADVVILIWAWGVVYAITKYGLMTITPAAAAYNILATMADSLLLIGPEGRIVTANRATLDLFGYRRDELIGQPSTTISPNLDLHLRSKEFKHLSEEGLVRDYQADYYAKSGTRIPVNLSVSLLRDSLGELAGMICVAKDMREINKMIHKLEELVVTTKRSAVSEHQKAQELETVNKELLETTERLDKRRRAMIRLLERLNRARIGAEKANQAKSDFLTNISHELRTPLNSIIGFSEVLLTKAFGPLNTKQEEYTSGTLDSGKHLLSLINDVLDISKVEAGQEELNLSSFSLRHLVKESMAMFKQKALKHNLQFSFTADENLGMTIADKRKLKQILFNLLSNATKFTPSGGKVGLEVKNQSQKYQITVWDTGEGIAKEKYGSVFEKFQQLGSGYAKKHPGTGLGLALVKEFVQMHHGQIWLDSTLGKGSRFTFSLPKDLSYKIFLAYLDKTLKQAKKERSSLFFVMVHLPDYGQLESEQKVEEVSFLLEGLEQSVKKAFYKSEDKVFKFRTGLCVVVSSKAHPEGVQVVRNTIKENVDTYGLSRAAKKLAVEMQIFTYPEELKAKEEIVTQLERSGLYRRTIETKD